jgi:hypothetical protein
VSSPRLAAPTGITAGRAAPRWTPVIVRVLALATALTAVAAAAFIVFAIDTSRQALLRTEQPTAALYASGELAVALGDLDGQLATVLLTAGRQDLAGAGQQALQRYERRRSEAAGHLQRIASIVGADPNMPRAVRSLVDDFGRYQILAADAIRLSAGAGADPASALARYREATDLMHAALLPTVEDLVRANDRIAQRRFADTLHDEELALLVVSGAPALVLLLALQVFLSRRFRRRLHPWLVAATVALLGAGAAVTPAFDSYRVLGSDEQFEAVSNLVQARAVSYDAHADRLRFLLDPERAGQHQQRFLDKSQALVRLGGDASVDVLARFVAADPTDWSNGCSGHLPRARCSLESAGLRLPTWASVDQTLPAYLAYRRADQTVRSLADDGKRDEAMRLAVNDTAGAFERYDGTLAGAVEANRAGLHRMIAEERRGDVRWMAFALGICAIVVALLALGVRRRLAEFR